MQLVETGAPETWRERLAEAALVVASAERGRLVLWLAVAMVGGAALYCSLGHEPPAFVGLALVAVGVGLAALLRGRVMLPAAALLVAAIGAGFASAQWATFRAPPLVELPTRASIVTGTVRMAELLPQGRRITLEAVRLDDGPRLARDLRIRLRAGDPAMPVVGDRIQVRAMLQRPSGAAYPGGWDIQFDAFHAGLAGFGYALNPLTRLESTPPQGLLRWMQALQEAIILRIRAVLPGADGAITAGLMVGGMAAIPTGERAAFRDSGLAHLLSISGLHLGIAMALVFGAVRILLAAWEWGALRLPTKAIAAVASLAGGGFYTLLTGAQVPMLRSFAMASLVTLAVVVGRRALTLRGWALAMAAVVLVAPQEVVGVSFQMSFSAVLALIAGFEALRPWLLRLEGERQVLRRIAAYVAALALTSALAGTASAPFGAYHFGHVQVYYVLANMVAVPLTALLVMPAAVLALVLMPLHLEWLALEPMAWGVRGLMVIAHTVTEWPGAVVVVPHITSWGLVVLSLGLAWLGLWRSRLRLLGVVMITAGLLSPLVDRPPDILVSADARLIGLRTSQGLFVQRLQGGNTFVIDSWLQRLALRDWQPMPLGDASVAGDTLTCSAAGCTWRPTPSQPVALVLRGQVDDRACAAAVVVSPEPVRLECPSLVPKVDRFSVWREGSHAIWLDPSGVRMASDRGVRGNRPWVISLPTRTRVPQGVPLRPAEVDD